MKTKPETLTEPCMLVPVSDLIHLIEVRNMHMDDALSPRIREHWLADYADMLAQATRKLAAFNRKTVQQ